VLRSVQSFFPVALGERILGLIDRETILQKACTNPDSNYITEIMIRQIPEIAPSTSLREMLSVFEQLRCPALLVGSSEDCLGFVFLDQLNDLLLVNEMVRQNIAHRELERELGSP
jgi:predicted transcriptional regulator